MKALNADSSTIKSPWVQLKKVDRHVRNLWWIASKARLFKCISNIFDMLTTSRRHRKSSTKGAVSKPRCRITGVGNHSFGTSTLSDVLKSATVFLIMVTRHFYSNTAATPHPHPPTIMYQAWFAIFNDICIHFRVYILSNVCATSFILLYNTNICDVAFRIRSHRLILSSLPLFRYLNMPSVWFVGT